MAQMSGRDACNKLCKWRSVLAGWMIGSKPKTAPGVQGYRHLIDRTLLLRAEIDALCGLLLRKGVITAAEFDATLAESALAYDQMLEHQFPGYRTTMDGVSVNPQIAAETNRVLGFPE
jgi:hypothetical protein